MQAKQREVSSSQQVCRLRLALVPFGVAKVGRGRDKEVGRGRDKEIGRGEEGGL